jgi:excinuclease ABC subunit B
LKKGQSYSRDKILRDLVRIYYERNDLDFVRGKFRVRGDVVEIFPADSKTAFRVELFGEEIEKISQIDPLKGSVLKEKERAVIYPAKHFITPASKLEKATQSIKEELEERLKELNRQNKLLEAQRLEQRTRYDLEMLSEIGYCAGVENYSRHLSGRRPGERPSCLLDYFPQDFLMIIDESHATIPQLNGMFNGDRSRKETLVRHGFRLPSALDNRPLRFEEFELLMPQTIYVSATPGPYELKKCKRVVEQIIRPTGLIDPEIIVKPTRGQIDDLLNEIEKKVEKKERVLVTTLTKRMAEDLCDYLNEMGAKVRYLHSEIDAIQRVEILRDLRLGEFDVLVGINLLREGLDLPEVALVAVLDADKEGFLRSETSLIQVSGRAARHIDGYVIMYADDMTSSLSRTIKETDRRRKIQREYNQKNKITPRSIKKSIEEILGATRVADRPGVREARLDYITEEGMSAGVPVVIIELERQMARAAQNLEFEKAAKRLP